MDTDQQPNDMNPAEALAWLVEMGADEIVGEVAVNRFSDGALAIGASS